MKNKTGLSAAVTSRNTFKRKFSFMELYRSFVHVPKAAYYFMKNNKNKTLDPQFLERLQLAVTEVNGCAACSYQHTKMALQMGMSNEEISAFLTGSDAFIQESEARAIVFAQHFADSRGFPKQYAFEAIQEEYGESESQIIMSALQLMLTGNIYGLPFSAFLARLKGQPYDNSSLTYEIFMLLGGFLILPIALLHGLIRSLLGFKNYKLDNRPEEEN